jgi:5-methyltetrahydrofolate--homocysteine methyltransferase
MNWIERLRKAVVDGQKKDIVSLATEAIKEGVSAQSLVNEAMIPAMNTVAELWQKEEYFLPEVLRSAKTMQDGMDALKPHLTTGGYGKDVYVAIGTVKGDQHDIGKNLVAIMLEGAGYRVKNMGVDLPAERFLEAAKNGAQVIGLSSLLTTSMTEMKGIIDLIKSSGFEKSVTVMVGGAPVTKDFAMKIGANYYADDAARAVQILNDIFN